jgi:hypothetical protein
MVLADMIAQRERGGHAQADPPLARLGIPGAMRRGVGVVQAGQKPRIADHARGRGALRHELDSPGLAAAFVAHGGVGERAAGQRAGEQVAPMGRPVAAGPHGVDGQREIAAGHFAGGPGQLGREIEVRVGQQVAPADHRRVASGQPRADMGAQAPAGDEGQRRARRDMAQARRHRFEQGHDVAAARGAGGDRPGGGGGGGGGGGCGPAGAPGNVDGEDLCPAQRGAQFAFEAFGQQAIAQIGAVLDVEQRDPQPRRSPPASTHARIRALGPGGISGPERAQERGKGGIAAKNP